MDMRSRFIIDRIARESEQNFVCFVSSSFVCLYTSRVTSEIYSCILFIDSQVHYTVQIDKIESILKGDATYCCMHSLHLHHNMPV